MRAHSISEIEQSDNYLDWLRLPLAFVVAVLIGVCSFTWVGRDTTKVTPPRYHNAENISQQEDFSGPSFPKGIISFTTTDKPEVVHAFYRGALKAGGWEFGHFPFSDNSHTAYFQYWPDDGPVYKVLVSAKALHESQTQVVITMTSNYHSWHGELWAAEQPK